MRQRRWLDVVKDYDSEILYHPSKANVVVNALIRRAESATIRDICMRMTMMTLVLDTIREGQAKHMYHTLLKQKHEAWQYKGFHSKSSKTTPTIV